jgi:hypothetical protein
MSSRIQCLFVVLAVNILAACSPQAATVVPPTATFETSPAPLAIESVLPGSDVVSGWTLSGPAKSYNRDNLFNLVDGQADGFFVYGFEQVVTQRYVNGKGTIVAEVWQLSTPADAYGLYTFGITGQSATIGNDGDSEPGRRLSFWQDHYTVHVSSLQPVDDAVLWVFAKAIAAALSSGGAAPPLISNLPKEGLQDRSVVFFHEELSIQDQIWLGGKNILGLSHETNGVVARYQVAGQLVHLLLVEYPDAGQATAALSALKSSAVKDLAAAGSRDRLLGAVFGKLSASDASALVSSAIAAK